MKLKIEECINKNDLYDNNYYYIKSNNFNIAYWSQDKDKFLAETKKGVQSLDYNEAKPFYNTKTEFKGEYKTESNLIFNMTEYKLLLKDISEKRPEYTACFLNENDTTILLELFKNKIPESWRIKCHHMTLNLGGCKNENLAKMGTKNNLKVIGFSICEELGVAALKIESSLPSDNETKHITLAISANGSAMNSNKLTKWESVNNEIIVSGIVGECLNNGDILFPKKNKKNKLIK
jgi:hypothetical protein